MQKKFYESLSPNEKKKIELLNEDKPNIFTGNRKKYD